MPLKTPIVVESERLVVRPVEETDLQGLMLVNGNDEATRFLPYESWRSLTDARAWFERMRAMGARGESIQYVLIDKASNLAIGTCLLFRYEESSARAELGYVLGRAYWSRGIMSEALVAVLHCAFGAYGLRRLEAEVDPLNRASSRLLEGLGFTREGQLRKRWVDKGAAHDTIMYGLLNDEWHSSPGIPRNDGHGNSSGQFGPP